MARKWNFRYSTPDPTRPTSSLSLTSFFKSLSLWPSTGRHFRHYKVAGVFVAAVILFVGSSFQLIPNFS